MELEQTTQTQELTELVTEEGTIWNQQKAKQLGQYMEIWGQERNQNYQAYQPGHSVAFYTIQVPDDLLSYEPKIQPAIGNNPIWLNWSETGSEGGYCLVAVYSDSATQVAQKHVYLFTLVNGEAKVYVSKEQPVEEQPYLFLKEKQSMDISIFLLIYKSLQNILIPRLIALFLMAFFLVSFCEFLSFRLLL
ncbi:lipoprotein [Enterococcus sp. DIV1420a]